MIFKDEKALCAISGGVDSAVSAALLQKAGYEVIGAFIKCYTDPIVGSSCWINERRDALRVCAKLGIKCLEFDFEKEYRRTVLNYLFREYRAGRTPNPDVICNQKIKIPLLWREAKRRGFKYMATGHYAKVVFKNDQARLYQAADKEKDQTYFLHQLKQTYLRHLLFPLGHLVKKEVRILARRFDLPVANKEESMGICFVGEAPMKKFLKQRIKPKRGKIITSSGQIIGEHEGLAFYTIGQRHWGIRNHESGIKKLATEDTRPLYVVNKQFKSNKLVVGFEDDRLLYKKEFYIQKINWLAGQAPKFPLKCEVRLRHRQPLQGCQVLAIRGQKELKVRMATKQRAVTPGQFAVFYKNGECLGGGEIV